MVSIGGPGNSELCSPKIPKWLLCFISATKFLKGQAFPFFPLAQLPGSLNERGWSSALYKSWSHMTVSHCGLPWKYEFGDEDRGFKQFKK